jgi:hypothetical protein
VLFASIDITIPKKLKETGTTPKHLREMQMIAATAIDMVRKRYIKTQTDGRGKKAKPLRKRRGFVTAHDDPRFLDIGKIVGKKVKIRVDKSYPVVKQKLGGKPVKDGKLTGAMWASLKPTIKRIPGGWVIILRFTGSVKTGKIEAGTKRKQVGRARKGKGGRKIRVFRQVPKFKTVSFKNRDKAKQFQKHSKAGISLLSLTQEEREQVAKMYTALIELFGEKQQNRAIIRGG